MEERQIVTPTYRSVLIEREKSFPTGLDMEFGKDSTKCGDPTQTLSIISLRMVVVRLDQPVTFHNMIVPDKEVQVSLLFLLSIIRAQAKPIFWPN